MNDQEKEIAIAEACGQTNVRERIEQGERFPYLTDLNAMHEAEATIRGDARWQTYKKELRDICDSAYPCEDPYHAPAKLRAEAFLMTIKQTSRNFKTEGAE